MQCAGDGSNPWIKCTGGEDAIVVSVVAGGQLEVGVNTIADSIVDLYQRHAVAWSRDRGDGLIEKAWLERFLALLPQNPTVLDLGCGCGVPIARYLLEHHCRVTGVDAASAMITCARSGPPRANGLSETCERWR